MPVNLPLIVVPMLILAAVGFSTSNREAAKTSARYLAQRETDLRTIAENPSIANYFNNVAYGLVEEAGVYRHELALSLKRFAERSNSAGLIYPQVRYIDAAGVEMVKIVDGGIVEDGDDIGADPFFVAVKQLAADEMYRSPVGPRMIYAVPVYDPDRDRFEGAVVLDFVYPVEDFQRTTMVIALIDGRWRIVYEGQARFREIHIKGIPPSART